MIEMTYHNDHKEKWQSHEISIREPDFYNAEENVWSHNPFDITGYGATKEEAIEDFKNKKIGSIDGATWQYSSYSGREYDSWYDYYAFNSYFYYIPRKNACQT